MCGIASGCGICHADDRANSPCKYPLNVPIARVMWERNRAELIAEWNVDGLGRLDVPCFGSVYFDDEWLVEDFDLEWSEREVRNWGLVSINVCAQRAYDALDLRTFTVRDPTAYSEWMKCLEYFSEEMSERIDQLMALAEEERTPDETS
jgi:hypothetical protein